MLNLKKVTLILTCLIGYINFTHAQVDNIYEVNFNFRHSLRIPNHYVSVEFKRYGDSVMVHVKSDPLDDTKQWEETKQDYIFELSKTEFDQVVLAVQKINCTDITNQSGIIGFDGTTCEIEFGSFSSGMTYKVWSPDYETKERNLQAFLDACRYILKTAKLNPNEIL